VCAIQYRHAPLSAEPAAFRKIDYGLCVLPLRPRVKIQVIGDFLEQGGAQLPRSFTWDLHVGWKNIWSADTRMVQNADTWLVTGARRQPAHGAVTTSRRFYDSSTGCPCVNKWPSRSPSWSSSVWLARHGRIWQTTVSLLPTSERADSDWPTQRCASSDVQITVLATSVLRLLDHACGTRCQFIYGSATVSDSLNGCWRPPVFGTTALC